jgi:hypothetical protein
VKRQAEFGIVYPFIGAHALKVDHGAKSPEEAPFIERFQKAPGLISQKRSLKALDMLNFIKREIKNKKHLVWLWMTESRIERGAA